MQSRLDAEKVSASALPVIDISGLDGPNDAQSGLVVSQIRSACLEHGFFYITGHGVAPALIQRVLAAARLFFAQPLDDKLSLDKAHSPANRGYERLRGQTLEPGAPADLKEGFYLGPDLPADDPRVRAGKFNHGANQWPPGLDDFAPAMDAYAREMKRIVVRLMRLLALSLDLPEDHFDAFCADPHYGLRLLHYPPQPAQAAPGEKGAGAHTDFGAMTILLQDDHGGLQVLDRKSGAWIHADPLPGSFVVNLGDLIARWTNDTYKSTLHRVVNMSGQERYSIPFFFSGNIDHIVECLPTCRPDRQPPLYAPLTVEAHLRAMYGKTYG